MATLFDSGGEAALSAELLAHMSEFERKELAA